MIVFRWAEREPRTSVGHFCSSSSSDLGWPGLREETTRFSAPFVPAAPALRGPVSWGEGEACPGGTSPPSPPPVVGARQSSGTGKRGRTAAGWDSGRLLGECRTPGPRGGREGEGGGWVSQVHASQAFSVSQEQGACASFPAWGGGRGCFLLFFPLGLGALFPVKEASKGNTSACGSGPQRHGRRWHPNPTPQNKRSPLYFPRRAEILGCGGAESAPWREKNGGICCEGGLHAVLT